MLILDNAILFHVPKTGGTWVRAALVGAAIPFRDYLVDGDPHGDLSYCPSPELFKIAFVRHPGTLYPSYWRYKMREGWDAHNPFDIDCRAESFGAFVRNVVERYPAWCSRMFEDYVGLPDREIEFVGRFERLADDLVQALMACGVTFDEKRVRSTPALNVSARSDREPLWTSAIAAAVAASERDALARFGYAPPPWTG